MDDAFTKHNLSTAKEEPFIFKGEKKKKKKTGRGGGQVVDGTCL